MNATAESVPGEHVTLNVISQLSCLVDRYRPHSQLRRSKLKLIGSLVTVELLPFDEYVRSLHRKRMSAGVLFRDHEERVLLVEPSYKPHWDIPGGVVDEGEAPWRTAVREVREIGLETSLGRPLVIDYQPDDGPMPEGMAFVFDGGLVSEQDLLSRLMSLVRVNWHFARTASV